MNVVALSCLVALTFCFTIAVDELITTCEYNGYKLEFWKISGREWSSADLQFQPEPCKLCYCNNGVVVCNTRQCDQPKCPNDEKPIKSNYLCCPYCPNDTRYLP